MARLTKLQVKDRIDYVLLGIRSGLSRPVITVRFMEHYQCGSSNAKYWYVRATNDLIVADPNERVRSRVVLLEAFYAQLANFQADLTSVAVEVAKVDAWWELRDGLQQQLLARAGNEDLLRLQLSFIPQLNSRSKTVLLLYGSKIRSQMVRVLVEIGEVQGLYLEEMSWLKAAKVLVENNLLPASVAESLLVLFRDFTASVDAVDLVDVIPTDEAE